MKNILIAFVLGFMLALPCSAKPAPTPTATPTPVPTPVPTPASSAELLTTENEKALGSPIQHADETSKEYDNRFMEFVLRELQESRAKREAEDAAILSRRGVTPTPAPTLISGWDDESKPKSKRSKQNQSGRP